MYSKKTIRLIIDKKIGEGAFGIVYSAQLVDKEKNQTTVAIKTLRGSEV
jgi:hypothetical protein